MIVSPSAILTTVPSRTLAAEWEGEMRGGRGERRAGKGGNERYPYMALKVDTDIMGEREEGDKFIFEYKTEQGNNRIMILTKYKENIAKALREGEGQGSRGEAYITRQ